MTSPRPHSLNVSSVAFGKSYVVNAAILAILQQAGRPLKPSAISPQQLKSDNPKLSK